MVNTNITREVFNIVRNSDIFATIISLKLQRMDRIPPACGPLIPLCTRNILINVSCSRIGDTGDGAEQDWICPGLERPGDRARTNGVHDCDGMKVYLLHFIQQIGVKSAQKQFLMYFVQ
jgi:hypothetical protein